MGHIVFEVFATTENGSDARRDAIDKRGSRRKVPARRGSRRTAADRTDESPGGNMFRRHDRERPVGGDTRTIP
jgi:hypothetical protein